MAWAKTLTSVSSSEPQKQVLGLLLETTPPFPQVPPSCFISLCSCHLGAVTWGLSSR
jgi:hypothetical protein